MKLETFIKNYNIHDAEDLIISIVVAWEQGQKLVRIYEQYKDQINSDNRGRRATSFTFVKKVILKHGINDLDTTLKQRREYWEKNNLWEFANNLRKQLYKEIPQFTLIDYDVHKSKNYNENDLFYKHFTKTNMRNYNAQKSMAKKRGISWEFNSFEEWLTWWLQTGKFDQRGVTNEGYQMCRYNDTGPYSPTNCYCATGKENKDDFWSVSENRIKNGQKIQQARQKKLKINHQMS